MPTSPVQYAALAAITGNLDTKAAGTTTGLTAIPTANIKDGTLGALVTLDIETNTITVAFGWQVSDDNSTFYDMPPENNAALVVFGTGTAGADASVSKVVPAPRAAWKAWKYIRPALYVGVTTGAAVDTYSVTPKWLTDNGF